MPMPVQSLPLIQQWDCHSCGNCCRSYQIRVTEVESAKIDAQGWNVEQDLHGLPAVVPDGQGGKQLNHRADHRCVFLDDDNRCKIHAKFGEAAKPMACRIYPFVLVPTGDHWRVSMRLACPSVLKNEGRALTCHKEDLQTYAGLIEADASGSFFTHGKEALPPPELGARQSVPWAELFRFVSAFAKIMKEQEEPIEHRLRRWIALAGICRTSRFDSMSGSRLDEFLSVVSAAVDDDVPVNPNNVPAPSLAARMIFRQFLAIYSRKDQGTHAGIASKSRMTRIRAAWCYAVGRGTIPKLHGLFPEVTFRTAYTPSGPLSPESEQLLQRYFLLKLESMQFCGPTNFRRSFWAGLDSLIFTYPIIRWLTNVFAAEPTRTPHEALQLAVQIVDDSYGFNPLLAANRQAWAIQTLTDRGDLAKLVAWFAHTEN